MNLAAALPYADAWGMHGDIGAGWWIIMMLLMVAFVAAIFLGGAHLLRGSADTRPAPPESPTDILERRFADGEISIEEYRDRRAMLTDRTPPAGDQPHVPTGTA